MRILVICQQFEEPGRGISAVGHALVVASRDLGHEVSVLSGYIPMVSTPLNQRADLAWYLSPRWTNVAAQFGSGKARRLGVLKAWLTHRIRVSTSSTTEVGEVNVPLAFHMLETGHPRVFRWLVRRAVRRTRPDVVLLGAPLPLTSRDVRPAKLVAFIHDFESSGLPEADLYLTNSEYTKSEVLGKNPDAMVEVLGAVVRLDA